ncbi:MAG TPA: endoribonuclease MazF [Allosphingosinicella sp.]|nr:endoribonuclease MazF [Allosphingosinicella sp.]
MTATWVPDAGDIIWLNFDPQAGHEQAGHRPALVLSPAAYNGPTGLLLCVPMTMRAKGYRFEVTIAGKRGGVALADQVKSVDWRARKAMKKAKATAAELEEIRARVKALVG